MPELYALFEAVSEGARKIERETRSADNPLVTLLLVVLREQTQQIERLLPKLRDERVELADCKKEIAIVYNDDDLLDSYFRSWLRHLKWSEDPFEAEGEHLLTLLEEMKSRLKEAARLLEDRYGYDAVKYVIPSFYLPILR
ncbi:hypothetical protein [Cohnella sp. JJ-181]|uniref:hypothetical protein n=1 Tax=Cohnella rhizoplanae TaxID=2974897 RepID=UPI0022FF5C0A|nr:hypothetical protein [Cohnella sp. JJ-181]CAI6034488.1 hypothetical protein COHCIP112018_00838 [Cohnella sp. JJ-181]